MDVKRLEDLRRFSADKLQKVSLFETERFFCDLYCLLPGQAQKPHAHPGSDKVYAVLAGAARVQVGSEVAVLQAGEAVLAAAGAEHGLENASNVPLTVLVFMAPRPEPAR